MNGYLLTLSARAPADEATARGLRVPGEVVKKSRWGDGVTISSWGNRGGDIEIVDDADDLLIIHGYISGGPGLANFRSRQAVSQQLRERLRAMESLADLARFAAQLNGAFAILYLEPTRRILRVITDRLATRQVWGGRSSNSSYFSSHSTAVSHEAHLSDPNLGALASVLLYGGCIEPTAALFDGISSQPAGTVSANNLSGEVERKSYYRFMHRPERRSRREWTGLAVNSLCTAAQRQVDVWGTPVLFLSGGVDSRLVGSALASIGCEPLSVTIGDSPNLETRVAERIAAVLGTRHHLHLRDKHYYLRKLRRSVFESGGRYRWRHSHFSPAFQHVLSDQPDSVAYLGDFAEAFSKLFCQLPTTSNWPFNAQNFVRHFDELPLKGYRPVNRARTLRLLQPEVQEHAIRDLKGAISRRFEALVPAAKDPKILCDLFFRWEEASILPTFQMFLDIRCVGAERNLMHDAELHGFLETLPSQIRDSAGFGAQLISRLKPAAGLVPDANTLLPLVIPRQFHRLSKRLRPLLGRARRALGTSTYRTTSSWSLLTLLYAADREWRQQFESVLLNEHLFDSRIFDRAAIESAWQQFVAGDQEHYQDLENLLSFGLLTDMADEFQSRHTGVGEAA